MAEQLEQLITVLGHKAAWERRCGKVLTGLLKKIDSKGTPAFNINSLDDIRVIEKLGEV